MSIGLLKEPVIWLESFR